MIPRVLRVPLSLACAWLSAADLASPQQATGAPERPFLAALSVASVDRSTDWYARHLGFRIVRPPSSPRPGITTGLLELNGFYLELAAVAGSRVCATALGVDSTLAGGVRYTLIRDPDGTVIQLFGPLDSSP